MIKTIIIEDEAHCTERLLSLIERNPTDFSILATCQTVEEAIEVVPKLQPDLIFLDIIIHHKTAFDFLQQISQINFKIIFTTAFDEYAIKAIKMSAFDYLLKPIDIDDFNDTINRLMINLEHINIEKQKQNLIENIAAKRIEFITLPNLSGGISQRIDDIILFEADTYITNVHTTEGIITVTKQLKHFKNLLIDHSFTKPHKSYLINTKHIKKGIKSAKKSQVVMTNDFRVPVSVRKKKDFFKRYC